MQQLQFYRLAVRDRESKQLGFDAEIFRCQQIRAQKPTSIDSVLFQKKSFNILYSQILKIGFAADSVKLFDAVQNLNGQLFRNRLVQGQQVIYYNAFFLVCQLQDDTQFGIFCKKLFCKIDNNDIILLEYTVATKYTLRKMLVYNNII
uniref:Uncharacterized protein n=1 Tax=Spironucleus salmonicida TaxID=348837 RepID=V6LEK2_9EUKA|eukprot:EST42917.1 Hypothetical protein SS50377_ee036 [Spironucleus salmonicida]